MACAVRCVSPRTGDAVLGRNDRTARHQPGAGGCDRQGRVACSRHARGHGRVVHADVRFRTDAVALSPRILRMVGSVRCRYDDAEALPGVGRSSRGVHRRAGHVRRTATPAAHVRPRHRTCLDRDGGGGVSVGGVCAVQCPQHAGEAGGCADANDRTGCGGIGRTQRGGRGESTRRCRRRPTSVDDRDLRRGRSAGRRQGGVGGPRASCACRTARNGVAVCSTGQWLARTAREDIVVNADCRVARSCTGRRHRFAGAGARCERDARRKTAAYRCARVG